MRRLSRFACAVGVLLLCAVLLAQPKDALPSWNDGPSKESIVRFVTAAVARGGPGYIAPGDTPNP